MWATKWHVKEGISEDIMSFVTNLKQTLPGKCKPLIKTHKAKPYPLRLLLSGTGTPVQPISKLVQIAISHLTGNLPYPVIDTNELLQKVDKINEKYSPLPDVACFAVCGIVSLYPNVNNEMRVPATGKQNKTSKKKNSQKKIQIRNYRRGVFWRHLTSLSTAMHVSTWMGMAGRYLPSLITVPRWVPVMPVTMSTSSWVSRTGSWFRTVPSRFCRQRPYRCARTNLCILTGVGLETMALPPCQTLSTSLHLNSIYRTYLRLVLNGLSPTGRRLNIWMSSNALLWPY